MEVIFNNLTGLVQNADQVTDKSSSNLEVVVLVLEKTQGLFEGGSLPEDPGVIETVIISIVYNYIYVLYLGYC